MGTIYDLETTTRISGFARRVPDPVRWLDAVATPRGNLVLRWKAPVGVCVSAYRIERTREGRDYELIGETTATEFFIYNPPPGESWFYRVTAFNSCGCSGSRLVWLFCRGDRFIAGDHNQDGLLMPVAVVPGLQVNIWK